MFSQARDVLVEPAGGILVADGTTSGSGASTQPGTSPPSPGRATRTAASAATAARPRRPASPTRRASPLTPPGTCTSPISSITGSAGSTGRDHPRPSPRSPRPRQIHPDRWAGGRRRRRRLPVRRSGPGGFPEFNAPQGLVTTLAGSETNTTRSRHGAGVPPGLGPVARRLPLRRRLLGRSGAENQHDQRGHDVPGPKGCGPCPPTSPWMPSGNLYVADRRRRAAAGPFRSPPDRGGDRRRGGRRVTAGRPPAPGSRRWGWPCSAPTSSS